VKLLKAIILCIVLCASSGCFTTPSDYTGDWWPDNDPEETVGAK
jgi:hypothetical protein